MNVLIPFRLDVRWQSAGRSTLFELCGLDIRIVSIRGSNAKVQLLLEEFPGLTVILRFKRDHHFALQTIPV